MWKLGMAPGMAIERYIKIHLGVDTSRVRRNVFHSSDEELGHDPKSDDTTARFGIRESKIDNIFLILEEVLRGEETRGADAQTAILDSRLVESNTENEVRVSRNWDFLCGVGPGAMSRSFEEKFRGSEAVEGVVSLRWHEVGSKSAQRSEFPYLFFACP